jgi:hypothetical protein
MEGFFYISIYFLFRVPVGVPGTFPQYNGESSAPVPKVSSVSSVSDHWFTHKIDNKWYRKESNYLQYVHRSIEGFVMRPSF